VLCRRRKPTVETCVDNTAKLRPSESVLALRAAGAIRLFKPASTAPRSYGRRHRSRLHDHLHAAHNERRRAGNGLYTTIKYMRGGAGIGLGTTIKHLRRATSGAAGNGLGTMIKYLRRTTSAAANNGLSTAINPPCSVAAFVVNSEPHTGARPSARFCVSPEPELSRCVHNRRAW
jgi:hypothetical protein